MTTDSIKEDLGDRVTLGLYLTLNEINAIIGSLQELPFKVAAPLIGKIHEQAKSPTSGVYDVTTGVFVPNYSPSVVAEDVDDELVDDEQADPFNLE
jgi:hypothetical protein